MYSVPDSRICTASTSTPVPPFLYQILFLPTAGSVFQNRASHNSGSLVLQSSSLHRAIPHAPVSTVACRQEGHSSPLSETVPWKVSSLSRCGPENRHFPDSLFCLLFGVWIGSSCCLVVRLSLGSLAVHFHPLLACPVRLPPLSSSPCCYPIGLLFSFFFFFFPLTVVLWPFTFLNLVIISK